MTRLLTRQTLWFAACVWSLCALADIATTIIGLQLPNVVESNSLIAAYTGLPFIAVCALLKLIGFALLLALSAFFVWLLNKRRSQYAFLGTLPFWITAYTTLTQGVFPNLIIIYHGLTPNVPFH